MLNLPERRETNFLVYQTDEYVWTERLWILRISSPSASCTFHLAGDLVVGRIKGGPAHPAINCPMYCPAIEANY